MAFFKCKLIHTSADVVKRVQVRDRKDRSLVMVVERSEKVKIIPGAYGHENLKLGQIYKIDGRLAEKARLNTGYFTEMNGSGKDAKPVPNANSG